MMRALLGDSFPKRPITCTVLLLTMMTTMASLCSAVGIFSDGFDVATSGWLVYEDADQHYAYEHGTYVVEIRANGLVGPSWAPLAEGLQEQFTVEVSCQSLEESGGTYGLVIGADEKNYILVHVSPEGWFAVDMFSSGTWQPSPVSAAWSEAIRREWNDLRVVGVSGGLTFSVNGEVLAELPVVPFELVKVGVAVLSTGDAVFGTSFDDFLVWSDSLQYEWLDPPEEIGLEAAEWAYAEAGCGNDPTGHWYIKCEGVWGSHSGQVGILTPTYHIVGLSQSRNREGGGPLSLENVATAMEESAGDLWIHVWLVDPNGEIADEGFRASLSQDGIELQASDAYSGHDASVGYASFLAHFTDAAALDSGEDFTIRLWNGATSYTLDVSWSDFGTADLH